MENNILMFFIEEELCKQQINLLDILVGVVDDFSMIIQSMKFGFG